MLRDDVAWVFGTCLVLAAAVFVAVVLSFVEVGTGPADTAPADNVRVESGGEVWLPCSEVEMVPHGVKFDACYRPLGRRVEITIINEPIRVERVIEKWPRTKGPEEEGAQ